MPDLKDLLPQWPKAIPQDLICSPEDDSQKVERSQSILNFFISEPIADKSFLDFGCGEGHVVAAAKAKNARIAVGYDVKTAGIQTWDQDGASLFTNLDSIRNFGGFDVILVYDVIDHVDDVDALLQQVQSLCVPTTTVYLLAHPWIARHGGHLYQQFNYAFAHLVFNENELADLGVSLDPLPKKKVVYPIATYKKWIEPYFTIQKSDVVRDRVEPFFSKRPVVSQRILDTVNKVANLDKLPEFQMEQSFHEFVLKLK